MDIGIIGSGSMGTTLSELWSEKGHRIFLGSRSADRLATWADKPNIETGSYAEALAFSDTVVLTTGWADTQVALETAGSFAGKILVDCTNPEVFEEGVPFHHAVGHTTSGAEIIAGWAAGAKVAKAFNHFYGSMLRKGTRFAGGRAMTFMCGDDAAKDIVARLAKDLDVDVIDAGELTAARYMEPLSALWVELAHTVGNGADIGLAFLQREQG